MARATPQFWFDTAVSKLNGKNLLDLWSTSCIFSCIDYFDTWNNNRFSFLYPILNLESVSMFHKAILASKASDYKRLAFTSNDLPYVLNALNDATSRTGTSGSNQSIQLTGKSLIATIVNSQIRFQEHGLRERLGRIFAMFQAIPDQFKDELQKRQKDHYIDLPQIVQDKLGLSVREFLLIGFGCIALYKERFEDFLPDSNVARKYVYEANSSQDVTKRQSEVLAYIVTESKSRLDTFSFSASDLVLPNHSVYGLEKVEIYLRLIAKTTRELQGVLNSQPQYSQGHIPDRLSPLERYPVVALADGKYIIPNLRYFDMSMTDLLHFILQEYYPDNRYNELRGVIQEIYLDLLIRDRLPNIAIIPETTYHKSKNRVDGPDLTLVDRSGNKLIAVESKAKRMRVSSRVNPASSALMDDLQRAFDAFAKLPGKIRDIYAGLPEYSSNQEMFNATQSNSPICVVVVGEGVTLLPEVVYEQVKNQVDHVLRNYPYPYCLMRIEVFEDAVEIAARSGVSLYEILQDYWIDTQEEIASDYRAETFRGRSAYMIDTFTKKYVDMLFADWDR